MQNKRIVMRDLFCVAGSLQQFRYIGGNQVHPTHFVSTVHQLIHRPEGILLLYGTWSESPRIKSILEYARVHQWHIVDTDTFELLPMAGALYQGEEATPRCIWFCKQCPLYQLKGDAPKPSIEICTNVEKRRKYIINWIIENNLKGDFLEYLI